MNAGKSSYLQNLFKIVFTEDRWKFFKHPCSSSAHLCANADRENILAGDKKFEDEED